MNISCSVAYASGSLVAIISPVYWNRDYGAGFGFLYLLTTQMIGSVICQSRSQCNRGLDAIVVEQLINVRMEISSVFC